MKRQEIKPFLRWVGGKSKLASTLIKFAPPKNLFHKYYEPFLGAGSLFFSLQPAQANLSDINKHLINTYIFIRDNPRLVHNYLQLFKRKTSHEFYYQLRDEYNRAKPSIKQAARFIYLNKTSFNGIFRVNLKGDFNVPYGKIVNPALPTLQELRRISALLAEKQLLTQHYSKIRETITENDFVYIDPPYPPLNGTSFFTHYTIDRFSNNDQVVLKEFLEELSNKNIFIMISNADTKVIRRLYKGWNLNKLEMTRWVTCKKQRTKVNELIITNYSFY